MSTNGCRKLVGSRSLVMKPTSPDSVPPASAIDSLALSRADSLGWALKPEPGEKTLAAIRPSASAITVIEKK